MPAARRRAVAIEGTVRWELRGTKDAEREESRRKAVAEGEAMMATAASDSDVVGCQKNLRIGKVQLKLSKTEVWLSG